MSESNDRAKRVPDEQPCRSPDAQASSALAAACVELEGLHQVFLVMQQSLRRGLEAVKRRWFERIEPRPEDWLYPSPRCSVPGCGKHAEMAVLFEDFYPHNGQFFRAQDHTCPYLCREHAIDNERRAVGTPSPREPMRYPYTNRAHGQGVSAYLPLYDRHARPISPLALWLQIRDVSFTAPDAQACVNR